MDQKREDLFKRYESAVRAFKEAIEQSKGLAGPEFSQAIRVADRLYLEAARLEQELADYDKAMR